MVTSPNHFDQADAILEAESAWQQVGQGYFEVDPGDGEHLVPGELRRFLAQLRLLHHLPFSYLVPDADLLPLESIRFFFLDRNWTDAVTQGVLSVGTITTADRSQLENAYLPLRDEVDETERTIRAVDDDLLTDEGGTITGFLLRSKAVSGWPNLHVRAYARDVLEDDELTGAAESHPERMKVLRIERLAPAVLLVLIDGLPEVIHIEEPRQGIQYGVRYVDPPAGSQGLAARMKLREASTGLPIEPKDDFTDDNSVPVPFRDGAPGVIDLTTLRSRLEGKAGMGSTIEPNEFALQALRFPYRQVFGDPDDTESKQFYDLDEFAVTITMREWTDEMRQIIDAGAARPNRGGDGSGGRR